GIEARNRPGAVVDQMTERPVAQPEHQIAHLRGRLGVQLAEDVFDKPLIFFDPLRLDAVANESLRHGVTLSCRSWPVPVTFRDCQRIRCVKKLFYARRSACTEKYPFGSVHTATGDHPACAASAWNEPTVYL